MKKPEREEVSGCGGAVWREVRGAGLRPGAGYRGGIAEAFLALHVTGLCHCSSREATDLQYRPDMTGV